MTFEPDTEGKTGRGYVDTSPYWEGLRSERLILQYCLDNHRFQHMPRPVSIYSGTQNIGWRQASGEGQLLGWTRVRPAATHLLEMPEAFQALIQLDERIQLVALIIGCPEPNAGARVRIRWDSATAAGVLRFDVRQ
jgi:uncharacterized OB-fold protein